MAVQSWLARANRTGSFTTNSFNVPANQTGIFWVRTNVLGSQITDATRNLTLTVEVSTNGEQTWSPYISLTWIGGLIQKGTGNCGFVVDSAELAGKTIRATVTVSRQTNIGLNIETV